MKQTTLSAMVNKMSDAIIHDTQNRQTQYDEVAEFLTALRSHNGSCASNKYIADLIEQQAERISETEADYKICKHSLEAIKVQRIDDAAKIAELEKEIDAMQAVVDAADETASTAMGLLQLRNAIYKLNEFRKLQRL